jgi:hypothetical protein
MKHTPGPWKARSRYVMTKRPDRRSENTVAECRLSGRHDKEDAANALLIAAAPDLLAACEEMALALREIRDYTGRGLVAAHGDALDLGLRAIAKAKGTPPP